MKQILNPKLSCSMKYTEEEMARGFMLKAMSMSNQAHNYGKKEFPLYGIRARARIVSADILESLKFGQEYKSTFWTFYR